MDNLTPEFTCIKCGSPYKLEGMEASNKAMPGAKVTMIRCTCTKCGFMELRMDNKAFAQAMETKKN